MERRYKVQKRGKTIRQNEKGGIYKIAIKRTLMPLNLQEDDAYANMKITQV
jgi:hypothetical protein